jgi:hypothetical protein
LVPQKEVKVPQEEVEVGEGEGGEEGEVAAVLRNRKRSRKRRMGSIIRCSLT